MRFYSWADSPGENLNCCGDGNATRSAGEYKTFMDYMTDGKTVEIRTEDGRVVVGPGALELISSWEWLQEANRNARRGKRTRPSIMQYQDDLEHNLSRPARKCGPEPTAPGLTGGCGYTYQSAAW